MGGWKIEKFPLGENVECYLSQVKKFKVREWEGIEVVHGNEVEDPREGRSTRKRFLRDRFFLPLEGDERYEEKVKQFQSNIILVGKAVGVEWDELFHVDSIEEWAQGAIQLLKEKIGATYYLKTILDYKKKKDTYFVARGYFPFISSKANLKYVSNEDKHNYVEYRF